MYFTICLKLDVHENHALGGMVCDPINKICLKRNSSRGKEIMKIKHKRNLKKLKELQKKRKQSKRKKRILSSDSKVSGKWKPWVGTIPQGQSGFKAQCQKNLRLNGLTPESLHMKCAKKGDPVKAFGYQEIIDCCVRPDSPLTRMLIRFRTGSGKTFVMIRILNNYFYSTSPKIVIFPTKSVELNFYSELLTYPSRYRTYVMNFFRSKHWDNNTKTFLQYYEKDFRKWKCKNPACQAENFGCVAMSKVSNAAFNC